MYEPQAHLGPLDLVASKRDLAIHQREFALIVALRIPTARISGNRGRGGRLRQRTGICSRFDLVLMYQQAATQVVADVGKPFGNRCQQYRVLLASVADLTRQDLFARVDPGAETEEQAVEVFVGFGLVSQAVATKTLEDASEGGEALAAASWTGEPESWKTNLGVLGSQGRGVVGH